MMSPIEPRNGVYILSTWSNLSMAGVIVVFVINLQALTYTTQI